MADFQRERVDKAAAAAAAAARSMQQQQQQMAAAAAAAAAAASTAAESPYAMGAQRANSLLAAAAQAQQLRQQSDADVKREWHSSIGNVLHTTSSEDQKQQCSGDLAIDNFCSQPERSDGTGQSDGRPDALYLHLFPAREHAAERQWRHASGSSGDHGRTAGETVGTGQQLRHQQFTL